jgi:hypothetical protein
VTETESLRVLQITRVKVITTDLTPRTIT